MFQAIPVQEDNIFAFKVMGKLTDADYQQFLPELTSLIEQNGPISLLIELEDFHGWEAKAAWDDFEFGKRHDDDFLRIAIVTENNWQKWLSKISGAFSNAFFEMKVKTFVRDDFQNAWDWLREGNQNDKAVTAEQKTVMKPYSNIVVAVDFSPHSEQVLERAVELARLYHASLSLVHAVEQLTQMYSEYDSIMTIYENAEIGQQLYDNAFAQLKSLASSINHSNVHYDVLWGDPKSTVLSFATAQNSDLIVTGSHGRHGFARLLGSTSSGIVHNANCDVIVVKIST